MRKRDSNIETGLGRFLHTDTTKVKSIKRRERSGPPRDVKVTSVTYMSCGMMNLQADYLRTHNPRSSLGQ